MMNENTIIDELLKIGEYEEEDKDQILITDIETGIKEVRIYNQEWIVFDDDDRADEYAENALIEEDYLWRQAVANKNTIDGLEEWAKDVVHFDGAASVIGSYDGNQHEGKSGYVYIRRN